MNEQRIREIAEQSSYHAENSVDYYSGIVDGLTWEAKILKARDLKFAELIVKECIDIIEPTSHHKAFAQGYLGDVDGLELLGKKVKQIKQHFGVEE